MKNKLVNRLSFGAIATVFLYVAGFLWQYAYLGSITDHVGWIKIVTVDYLYLGIMAIMFTVPSYFLFTAVFLLFILYNEFPAIAMNRLWVKLLSYEKREEIWLSFNNHKVLCVGAYFKGLKFFFYFLVLCFFLTLPSRIINNAKNHLAYRLSSGPVDTLCKGEGNCHKGKLLYTSNNQFYFYTYNGSTDYRNGHLLVVNVNDASLSLAWEPTWKSRIEKIVEANATG